MNPIHVTGWKVAQMETSKDGKPRERLLSRQFTVKSAAEDLAAMYRAKGVEAYIVEQRHAEGPKPKRLVRPVVGLIGEK